MENITNDLSTLTNCSESVFNKLNTNIIYLIANYFHTSIINEQPSTEIDIGVGILVIKYDAGEIKYRFTPSQELVKAMSTTLATKQNLLVDGVEQKLTDKINKMYEELI